MEKKELLGVRRSPPLTKKRRKVTAGGGGGGGRLAKAIASYLASDSFMYASLVSNSQTPPSPSPVAAPSLPPAGAGALAFTVEESVHQSRLKGWRARGQPGHLANCLKVSSQHQSMLMLSTCYSGQSPVSVAYTWMGSRAKLDIPYWSLEPQNVLQTE
ncbi:hypothetical protein E2562_030607 [Oryza meyeriana var. granulata]|uniref:Uncharacterized protein n=1 Tax=Oryza meyeriana var. granulata TaxID=110450 RepID=A0A6G1CJI6_9ORYZ|nr:hypothetical protein E2562_030607 [Oryza meyeriana var. granulata]